MISTKTQTNRANRRMKMTRFLKYALAVLIGVGATAMLRAADAPANPAGDDKKPTREELQKMTPEERQARMKEWRDKQPKLTPEQREAQRKVWRERMEKKLEDLKKKKADGTLTPQEEKQLERMQELLKRWEQGSDPGVPGTPPAKPADKPAPPAEPK